MEEVNAKHIEIVEKKKVIDPVENDNSEEDASVLVDANKKNSKTTTRWPFILNRIKHIV